MHSIIHVDFAKASAQRERPTRAVPPEHERPHGPPRRMRPAVARVLAVAASRVDRDAARRVVA